MRKASIVFRGDFIMRKLKFSLNVCGSFFNYNEESKDLDLGWTISKNQTTVSYSLQEKCEEAKTVKLIKDDMPYVTQNINFELSTDQENNENGKAVFEPCVLHDYNIGKFNMLNMRIQVSCEGEFFDVETPIDNIDPEILKHVKSGSDWFVRTY